MKNFFLAAVTLTAILSSSCQREEYSQDTPDPARAKITFHSVPSTKSILGDETIESLITKVHIAVYDSGTGLLDAEYCGNPDNATLEVRLGSPCDIYALTNVDGIEFPIEESEVEDIAFRIVSYDDVASCGIPGCYFESGAVFKSAGQKTLGMTRLFAKVTLKIDYDGISGGYGSVFSNQSVYVHQANSLVLPFNKQGSSAVVATDILESSDYDPDISGSESAESFVFYVPENVQGVLLAGNSDQSLKSRENLQSVCPSKLSLLTYMEYKGYISSPDMGSGFDGEATYRFYLGEDAVSDFSLRRNRNYVIDLSFIAGNVFNPCWKVSSEVEDNRDLSLSRNDDSLESGTTLVVRPSHPATFTLNVSNGTGLDIADSGLLDEGETIPDLARPYWCSNIVGRTTAALLPTLTSDGLDVDFDSRTGDFSITVSDTLAFKAGNEYNLEFSLVPEEGRSVNLRLLAMDDIELVPDASVDEWYLAQRRSFTLRNAYSTYCIQASDAKVTCSALSEENTFDALAVNTCKSHSDQTVTLSFIPQDTMNDDPVELSPRIKVPLPMYYGNARGEIFLTMDGEPVDTGFNYYSEDGTTILPEESFDSEEFDKNFSYTVSCMPMQAFTYIPQHLDNIEYPGKQISIIRFSYGMFDLAQNVKGYENYTFGLLSYTPFRTDLYDEDQYPSLILTADNPFPNYAKRKVSIGSLDISGMLFTGYMTLPFYPKADYRYFTAEWNDTDYRGDFHPGISIIKDAVRIDVDDEEKSKFLPLVERSRVFDLTLTNKHSQETIQWQYSIDFY